jgi:hypothetical protein
MTGAPRARRCSEFYRLLDVTTVAIGVVVGLVSTAASVLSPPKLAKHRPPGSDRTRLKPISPCDGVDTPLLGAVVALPIEVATLALPWQQSGRVLPLHTLGGKESLQPRCQVMAKAHAPVLVIE